MLPAASQLRGTPGGGGSCCGAVAAGLLLCLCLGSGPRVAACPAYCLCASDIISCSGRNLSTPPFDLPSYATRLDVSHNALVALPHDWLSQPFQRLAALVLSWNAISLIEAGAFAATPRLLHLDLSSNGLTALNSSVFSGLRELKELLLFGNRIAQIEAGAFRGLHSLQKLYLSGNRLVAFPLGLYWEPGGPQNLTFLDLSYNRLSQVPVQDLLSLTRQGGIYFHENPLVCDCALLALLEYWMWRQYRPLVDFRGEYRCQGDAELASGCGKPEELAADTHPEERSYQVEPGKWLGIPCPGLASSDQDELVLFWVTPRTVLNASSDDPDAHMAVLPNGTLEIRSALPEDSGPYGCVTPRWRAYDPLEVAVAVGNLSGVAPAGGGDGTPHRSGAEHFNTAFTTLASCVVSIILVLLYLYLTPCRCRDSRAGEARGCGSRAIILCSDPREVESGQRRSHGKRVAFLEPRAEDSEVGVPKTPTLNSGHVSTEGILKNGSRTVGQTLTDPAHMA